MSSEAGNRRSERLDLVQPVGAAETARRGARCFTAVASAIAVGRLSRRMRMRILSRRARAPIPQQNYVRSALILSPLAQQGDLRAQAYLGVMYLRGQGVPQNFALQPTGFALRRRRACRRRNIFSA